MDEEWPRIHRIKAACCEGEIMNFNIPSQAPLLLARTALAQGWILNRHGEWLCNHHKDEHAVTPVERLSRIAEAHEMGWGPHGMVSGYCAECDHPWPCPTQVWAAQHRTVLDTWDPADDEDLE